MTSLICPAAARAAAIGLASLLAASLTVGCSEDQQAASATPAGAGEALQPVDPTRLGADRALTLRALIMPQRRITELLGGHEVRARSTLRTQPGGGAAKTVAQEVRITGAADGRFRGSKTTHEQYGQEVVWTGDLLYVRARYSKFVKRKARRGEPAAIADRLYGLLPAYVDLLERFLAVERVRVAEVGGRPVVEVRLAPRAEPAAAPSELPASKRWRRTLSVKSLAGKALLDARTGVPVEVELTASWSFQPPATRIPRSGIPGVSGADAVSTTTLEFSQTIEAREQVTIEAPTDALVSDVAQRSRREIERQILTGERPVPERLQVAPASDEQDDSEGQREDQ